MDSCSKVRLLILRISACSGPIKTTRGVLESSHYALPIGCIINAKHRSFANRLNSRGVYNPNLKPQSDISIPNLQYNDKSNNNKTTNRIVISSTIQPVYKHCSASLRSPSRKTVVNDHVINELSYGWVRTLR